MAASVRRCMENEVCNLSSKQGGRHMVLRMLVISYGCNMIKPVQPSKVEEISGYNATKLVPDVWLEC